jgi:hypothetical protein
MTEVTYIKKSTLEFSSLWTHFGMSKDNGGRWYPSDETPEWVQEYLEDVRSPSRAWPLSYAKAMLTQKFAKLVVEKDQELAVELGIAESAQ